MEYVLALLVMGAVNAACFLTGAKVGQTVSRGEPVTLPELNPVKAVNAHREARAASKEQDRRDVILRNIDCYDGTGTGQTDVPR